MSEEVKKRITDAYHKVLIPHVLKEVKSNLTCGAAGEWNILLAQVHERMLKMRREETSKLERKLKKEQDPGVVMQLFNVQPMNKVN